MPTRVVGEGEVGSKPNVGTGLNDLNGVDCYGYQQQVGGRQVQRHWGKVALKTGATLTGGMFPLQLSTQERIPSLRSRPDLLIQF